MARIHGLVTQRDPTDNTRLAKFDPMFAVPVVNSVEHYEIHEGHAFKCNAVDTAMADTDELALCCKTPAGTKLIHVIYEFSTLTGGHLDLVEGPTWTTGSGAQHAIFNRLRAVAMASSVLLEDTTSAFVANDAMVLSPAALAGGTVVDSVYAFAVKNRFSGAGRDGNEWVLQPDTTYAFRFVATAAANAAQILLHWYEHPTA